MAPKLGITLPRFVTVLACWEVVRNQAISFMEGTSGRQRVPNWAFELIEVPIPPLSEQEKIVRLLDRLAVLIEREQKLVGSSERLNNSKLFRTKQVLVGDFLLGERDR